MKTHPDGTIKTNSQFRFTFNKAIRPIESKASITSDAGALIVREIIHRLGIDAMIDQFDDPRHADHVRYSLLELIVHRVAMLAQGYSAQDDADKLAHDPAFRVAGWDRSGVQCVNERLASQPTLSRLLDILKTDSNFERFCDIAAAAFLEHLALDINDGKGCSATIDVDGFPIETHGDQDMSAYNGYHQQTEFYPFIAMLSVDGDFETGASDGVIGAMLRPGNTSASEAAPTFIDEVGDRVNARFPRMRLDYRLDAGLLDGNVINHIVKRGELFLGRVRSNPVLERMAVGYVRRKPGPQPDYVREYVYELGKYQSNTWERAHRIVLVVIDDCPKDEELDFGPRYFFLATNHNENSIPAAELLAHYRRRGTFEDRIGEFNSAINLNLSHTEFRKNEVLLQFGMFALNILNVIRSELESDVGGLNLVRVQNRVMKAGAWIANRGRQLTVLLAATAMGWWELLMERLSKICVPAPRPLRRGSFVPAPCHAFFSTPPPILE